MSTQRVRIVSTDPRYRKEPYPAIPVYNERIGTYLTGQHIDPTNPDTFKNLTLKEMLGEEKLSDEKREKFPHVIIPEHRIPISHLRWFDISVDSKGNPINPKDVAELNFFKLQDFVADSKGAVKKGYHYFYIEDLIQEAVQRISKRDARYQAEKKIREEVNIKKYKEIGLLLNYVEEGFNINVNGMSEVLLQDRLLEACEEFPHSVLKCFDRESEENIFVLKVHHYGIIQKKGKSFVDGQQYLGETIDDVKKFMRSSDGQVYKRRWVNLVAKREGLYSNEETKEHSKENESSLLGQCSFAIVNGDYQKALEFYDEAYMINPNNEQLPKLKIALESIKPEPKASEKKVDVNLVSIPENCRDEDKEIYEKINGYASNVVKLRAGKEGLDTAGKSEREVREMLINKELNK